MASRDLDPGWWGENGFWISSMYGPVIKNWGDIPIKNGDIPIKHGDFPIKTGVFPIKHGDFPIKNRDILASDLLVCQKKNIAIFHWTMIMEERGTNKYHPDCFSVRNFSGPVFSPWYPTMCFRAKILDVRKKRQKMWKGSKDNWDYWGQLSNSGVFWLLQKATSLHAVGFCSISRCQHFGAGIAVLGAIFPAPVIHLCFLPFLASTLASLPQPKLSSC